MVVLVGHIKPMALLGNTSMVHWSVSTTFTLVVPGPLERLLFVLHCWLHIICFKSAVKNRQWAIRSHALCRHVSHTRLPRAPPPRDTIDWQQHPIIKIAAKDEVAGLGVRQNNWQFPNIPPPHPLPGSRCPARIAKPYRRNAIQLLLNCKKPCWCLIGFVIIRHFNMSHYDRFLA